MLQSLYRNQHSSVSFRSGGLRESSCAFFELNSRGENYEKGLSNFIRSNLLSYAFSLLCGW